MQSTEESDQSPETQGNTRRIGNTCVSINLTFVKSRLGIFEAAIIVRILSWLWYFEIQDSVQHSKAGVDQKPSDLGRWILWRAALFYFYKQLYSPYRGGSRLCIDRGRTFTGSSSIWRYSGFKKKNYYDIKIVKKTGKRLRFWIRGLVNVLTNFPESLMCLVDPFKARDCFARSCVM